MNTTAHAFFNKPPGGTPRITPRYAQESAHSWITDAVCIFLYNCIIYIYIEFI